MLSWRVALLLAGCALLACSCGAEGPNGPAAVEEKIPEEAKGPALFRDITDGSGLAFTYRNGEEPNHLAILESLGGGVAVFDYDGDGLLDVFIPGGGYFAGKDNKEIRGHPCKLFKNLGKGKFKDVTQEVGLDHLAGGAPWFYTHGAAVGDYDRDGWPDLLVTGWGRVALFRNVPDGKGGRRFVDVTAKAGLDKGITWATSAGWADLDGDGYPDLYVCQYVNWSFANHPECTYDGKTRDVCPPKRFSGLMHKVYRNNGDGTFTDVSATCGLLPGGPDASKGLGVLIVDVNFDGKPDVYVANDTVDKFLYINVSAPGKIRFEEKGMVSGTARDDRGSPNGSMGLDAGDYDGSGKPALWVTNYENELHGLYQNRCAAGKIIFNFRTTAAGIAAIGQKYVGWGTGFIDVQNRGWEDIFVVNGHAIRHPTGMAAARLQSPVLLYNKQGKFVDISRRIGTYGEQKHLGRGLALGDLDNDGRIDLVISHMNAPVRVLRNEAKAGHWLGVELVGAKNADVVGARAELKVGGRTLTRFTKGGGSYLSSSDRRLHFGLGESKAVGRLTVTWPDGKKQHWDKLPVDRYHVLVQGQDKPLRYPRTRE
jgi:hypothetical protein